MKASEFVKLKNMLADSQYSAGDLRETTVELGALPVIPYSKNQLKGVRGILRVDRKFRNHGPTIFKVAYKERVAVERVLVDSRILASLTQHNLRDIGQAYVLFSTLHSNQSSNCYSSCQHA